VSEILTIAKLNQSYGQSHTLWDIDLSLPKGACVSLIGRNGVGKTTLLNCLMGLVKSDSGTIHFDGHDLSGTRPELRAPLGIGYVPQGRMIFPLLTVEENLGVGLPSAGRPAARTGAAAPHKARTAVPELVYELFPVLKSMRRRRGGDLSGGQQQQLAIGRALVLEPALLVLDEPTEGIQPSVVAEIEATILGLVARGGLSVLLVEQHVGFALRAAQRYYVLESGRVTSSGDGGEAAQPAVRAALSV
jgi:urea transport system ATP-binding protein